MARRIRLYVPSDIEVINVSPLTYVDTLYYELFFRITGSLNWNQQITYSPLPTAMLGSPVAETPYIQLIPLADQTIYEYQLRRFDSDNQPSDWFTGTIDTNA